MGKLFSFPVSYIGLPEVRDLLIDYGKFLDQWKDLPFKLRVNGSLHTLNWGDVQSGGGVILKCDRDVMSVIPRGRSGRVRFELLIGNCVVHVSTCDISDVLEIPILGASFKRVVYRYSDSIRDVTTPESEGRMSVSMRMQLSPPWCMFDSDICVIGVYVGINPIFVYRSIYNYLDCHSNLNLYEWLRTEWRKQQVINHQLCTSRSERRRSRTLIG